MTSQPHKNTTTLTWLKELRCPACGNNNMLFVADGGYVTCSWHKCPNPNFASAIQTQVAEAEHRARVDEHNKYIQILEQKSCVAALNWADKRIAELQSEKEEPKQ